MRTAWMLVGMLAAMPSCTSYAPAPLDLPTVTAEVTGHRLEDDDVKHAVTAFTGEEPQAWPPQRIDLRQAFAIALHCRPELRAARAGLAVRRATHATVGQWPNPALTIGPGIVTNPAGEIPWLLTAGIGLPIDLGGRRAAAVEAAASDVAAAQIEVARADQAIRADVAASAFAVDAARHRMELGAQASAFAASAARVAATRAEAGAIDSSAKAAADAAAIRAEGESKVARTTFLGAQAALTRSLGLGGTLDLEVVVPAPHDTYFATAEARPEDTVARSLDVGIAMCAYAHAEADLRLACAEQWPDLELGPGYEYDQGLHKLKLDTGFSLPLFHGNGAAIAQATAARTAAAAAVETAVAQAIGSADRALCDLATRGHDLAAAIAAATAMDAAVSTANARIEAGADDADVRLAAWQAAAAAEATAVDARHAVCTAWLAAELALQMPIEDGLLAWATPAPEEER